MPFKNPSKMREYILQRYHQRRADALEALGGKCVVCGTDQDLEFDHIDPETKSFNISQLWSVSKARFNEELSKCQLLCHDHHLEKSRPEMSAKAKEREARRARNSIGRVSAF